MPCNADTADMVTEQETQQIEQMINGADEGPAKTLLQRLVFTVRTLHRELRGTREERDQLLHDAERRDPLAEN